MLGLINDDVQRNNPEFLKKIMEEVMKCQVQTQTQVSINIFNQCKEMELEKLQSEVIKAVYIKLGQNFTDVTSQDGNIKVNSATNNLI